MKLLPSRPVKFRMLLLFSILNLAWPAAGQYTNGIFAEFNTSLGNFTCTLYYAQSPKTVANFIGLATGARAWLDEKSGLVRTNPLYNGVIFHRVISNFMNQAGSPTGIGNGGPGYQFRDEFTPALRHDGFGVLSMANSGPDSNGSQFFITVSPQPQLNDVHSVFGRLYGGSNVVYAINRVATDGNDRPLTNVVINFVTIRRQGPVAQAFDISTNGLPVATNLNLKIVKAAPNFVGLVFSNRLHSHSRFFTSTNLINWAESHDLLTTSGPLGSALLWSVDLPREFFRLAQVQYPPSLMVPPGVLNKTLTMNFSAGIGNVEISFNSSGGGAYIWSGRSTNSIYGYHWVQDPYRGRFLPLIFNGNDFPPMKLHLDYTNTSAGTFRGTGLPFYPYDIGAFALSGTFTSAP